MYADSGFASLSATMEVKMGYPAGTKQKGVISAIDAGGERASVSFFLTILTTGNIVAQTTAWAALMDAWDALFLGARIQDSYNDVTNYNVSRPANGAAREVSLKLIARDATTGQTVNYYCPTLDISLIEYIPNYGAKDVVDMTTTELAAFITALEAVGLKNPYAYGNAMTIVGVQVVRGQK